MDKQLKQDSVASEKNLSNALPPPQQDLGLAIPAAFQTLALADIKSTAKHGAVGQPSDLAVAEAREWVEEDEM